MHLQVLWQGDVTLRGQSGISLHIGWHRGVFTLEAMGQKD